MSDATDYAENQFMDMWFAGVAPDGAVADGSLALALWEDVAPADSPDFTNELAGDSYARISVNQADWTKDTSGSSTNYTIAVDADFGVLDSAADKAVEGVVVVRTDLTDDHAIYANGDVSETVAAGNEFKINAGDATFTMD